jgi:uncharacterized membrane protein YfcA
LLKEIKKGFAAAGLLIGIVNALFGAGGGIVAVPILKKYGLEKKEAHANAVAVILPITVLSAVIYLFKGHVEISKALPYIPAGIAGSLLGTYFLKKISPIWLRRIFGGFIVYAGIRLILR